MLERDGIFLNSIIWILLCACTVVITFRQRRTVGLVAGFLTTFLMNHWLASTLYIFSEQTLYPPSIVARGLEQSVLGMIAFAFGVIILAPTFTLWFGQKTTANPLPKPGRELSRQIQFYAIIGSAAYFLTPFISTVPVLNILAREVAKFAILAACLYLYSKIRVNAKNIALYAVGLGVVFVFIGVVYSGFASFGSVMAIFFIMFYLSQSKLDVKRYILLVLIGYLGISGFVAYLENRTEIRAQVWGGGDLEARLEAVGNVVSSFELFSPDNPKHVEMVEIRLNRNYFVGKAMANLDYGLVDYAQGGTIFTALIAPIPRVLWPDKPTISGGSTLFTQYTGIFTTPNTSTGLGLLLESYINFGSFGVILLFALYGLVIGILDARARDALDTGNYSLLAVLLLPGFEMIDPIDALAGVVAAMISAWLVVNAVLMAIRIIQGDQSQAQANPVAVVEPLRK